MKRLLTYLATAALLSSSGAVIAGTLDGTDHDFQAGTGVREGAASTEEDNERLCVYCHTPHNASTAAAFPSSPPLWNKDKSGTVFTPYDSGTMNASPVDPVGVSRACLGCHDGSVAISDVNWTRGVPAGFTVAGIDMVDQGDATCTYPGDVMTGAGCTPLFSTTLQTEHPVSMAFIDGLPELVALATAQADPDVNLYGAGSDQVECGSCHNPHDNTFVPFLRSTIVGDALCRNCHTY